MDLRDIAKIASEEVNKKLIKSMQAVLDREKIDIKDALTQVTQSFPYEGEITKTLINNGLSIDDALAKAKLLIEEYEFPKNITTALVSSYKGDLELEQETKKYMSELGKKEEDLDDIVDGIYTKSIRPTRVTLHNASDLEFDIIKKPNSVEFRNLGNEAVVLDADIVCPSNDLEGKVKYNDRVPSFCCEKKRRGKLNNE